MGKPFTGFKGRQKAFLLLFLCDALTEDGQPVDFMEIGVLFMLSHTLPSIRFQAVSHHGVSAVRNTNYRLYDMLRNGV